jgi:hypothetical protein
MKTDGLYTLVHTLTKSEKRYFALFCEMQEGDKMYLHLYKIIQQENGNAASIKQVFTNNYPKSLFDPARKHLYKILMKSLRSFRASSTIDNKLMNLVADIEILFAKGITEIGFAQLEKAMAVALQYEKFAHYLLLARMELQYLTQMEFLHMEEQELIARQEKINDILYHQLFINKHASLYEILLYRYFHQGYTRSQRDNERLNDLLLEEYQITTNKHYNSFESAKLHLHFQSTYFLMTGNYNESLKLYDELRQLFAQHKNLWEDAPVYYMYLINGILTGLKSLKNYQGMHCFLQDLQEMAAKTGSQHKQIAQLILGHKLSILIDLGEFENGISLIKTYEEQNSTKHNIAATYTQIQLFFYMASVYLGIGQYHTSLNYINQVLNTNIKYIPQQLYSLFRLLNLIIHLELGNDDYLSYEIKSVERKLKTQKKLFEVEKVLLHFFKHYLKTNRRKRMLQELAHQLQVLSHDPYEMQLLRQFDFISWVESKIWKVSFAQVLQEKSKILSS